MNLEEKRMEHRIDSAMFPEELQSCRIEVDDTASLLVKIEDISLTGICIHLAEFLDFFNRRKDSAYICLLNDRFRLNVKVIHSVPIGDGKKRIGMQFATDSECLRFRKYLLEEIGKIKKKQLEKNQNEKARFSKRRKEERFDASVLPSEMHHFFVHLSPDAELRVELHDVSMNGVGFIAAVSADKFTIGSTIVLLPVEKSFTIYGKIIHVSELSENMCRVGVELRHTVALSKYQDLIRSAAINPGKNAAE